MIPDIHLKPGIFDKAQKILESGQADYAIQLGDLTDDFGEEMNLGLYERTLNRAIAFHKRFPDTLWILSNHDFGYWHPSKGVRESGHSKFVEPEVLKLLEELRDVGGEQRIMYIVDDCIFTHAGLTKEWVDYQKRIFGIDRDEDIDDEKLMHIVNKADNTELWRECSPIWARPQLNDIELHPCKLQVTGHTPVKQIGVHGGCLSTDTFSTYRSGAPYGDQKFAIVDTETGEWKVAQEDDG